MNAKSIKDTKNKNQKKKLYHKMICFVSTQLLSLIFFLFSRLAAAASRGKKEEFNSKFGRDHVARSGSGLKPLRRRAALMWKRQRNVNIPQKKPVYSVKKPYTHIQTVFVVPLSWRCRGS